MRRRLFVVVAALGLALAAGLGNANPVGIPPNAKLIAVDGGPAPAIGIQPPAGAHGAFYYRVDFAA